ncbi:MAG TPA: SLBB domain-containing protein, partial [Longimicrobiales bacterium]|nr:SLBB domain-containing protein [Longimicrobiales bacterium]
LAAPAAAQVPDSVRARQEAERRLGRDVSQEEILDRLRRSGMTRAQVRAQLQRMGYDPTLADRYFDLLERDIQAPPGYADDDFVAALRRIGVMGRDTTRTGLQLPDSILRDSVAMDSLRRQLPDSLRWLLGMDSVPADTLEELGDTLPRDSLPIFGKSVFERRTTQFEPVLAGPVDAGYRLGPGDEIQLILSGGVEAAYPLVVSRQGFVVIPDVGQVQVAGLTLGQLEDQLYQRLNQVYSGVGRGAGATTRFALSMGELRTNQVFVLGDVERPGSYQVSAAATAFHALHRAGGPAANGSFRRIEVRRGVDVVRRVDLYGYLLAGDARDDVRLENGDIVFVPPVGGQVRVEGSVKRPAIYELLAPDELRDVLAYAGGPRAEASLRSVKIDRVLPPIERRGGVERVILDVDVVALLEVEGPGIPLRAGDRVQLFEVSDERRHRVTVAGQVRKPGPFQWSPGTTIWDVIERADGLAETAYTARAHIYRLNEDDGTRRLIRTPLLAEEAGRPVRDVALEDRDSVVVYSTERLRTAPMVAIEGRVRRPGSYPLAEGMTVEDLVLAAGGFTEGAYTLRADVARRAVGPEVSDTTAHVIQVALPGGPVPAVPRRMSDNGPDGQPRLAAVREAGQPTGWLPAADELELVHGDRVYIRKAPGFEEPRAVQVTGEVLLPGEYVLQTRTERVAELVRRAGGLKPEGWAPGFQLFRDGDMVGTDLEAALRDPGARGNVVLEDGDSLHVPRYDPTVLVTGEVAFATRVLYREGAGLDYYIERAGGFADRADEKRTNVTYQDGERAVVGKTLFWTTKPTPGPGSTVMVPRRPEGDTGFDWDAFISRTLGVLGTTATVLIAVSQVK